MLTSRKSFFLDKIIRFITGVPPSYDDTDVCHITTAFPRTRDEYVSVCGLICCHHPPIPQADFATLIAATGDSI